jgi:redox-sensitive bicupin YhaK (pirin superfamily)
VNNDDVVLPTFGFETHPHRDMEIVTWVMQGSLVHQESAGHNGIIYPGLAQRMSAGTGILHSEKNDSRRPLWIDDHREPVHSVPMWVAPDESGIAPGYEQLDIDGDLLANSLVPVASGMPKHKGAGELRTGDAVRFTAIGGQRVTATEAAEILVWEMHASVPA